MGLSYLYNHELSPGGKGRMDLTEFTMQLSISGFNQQGKVK